jgi:L-fuculose-phosphate aldolase
MTTDPRAQMVEICHLLASRTFTTATGGNVSVKMPDGTFWVTPSHLHKARVTQDDLVQMAANGTVLAGHRRPSSEMAMHLAVYAALPQAGAVLHAHPPIATGFAQAGKTIDARSSNEGLAILGPEVPLIPYARPGTDELAETVRAHLKLRNRAYLMRNHGVLTWGSDLWSAYDVLDTLELFAQSLLTATLVGGAVNLPPEECEWLETVVVPTIAY